MFKRSIPWLIGCLFALGTLTQSHAGPPPLPGPPAKIQELIKLAQMLLTKAPQPKVLEHWKGFIKAHGKNWSKGKVDKELKGFVKFFKDHAGGMLKKKEGILKGIIAQRGDLRKKIEGIKKELQSKGPPPKMDLLKKKLGALTDILGKTEGIEKKIKAEVAKVTKNRAHVLKDMDKIVKMLRKTAIKTIKK